ncbi:MAG: iron-containing redox enzyme family protein, partial [bacterium]|nr:iron-containing redox enzyme family protein [bacterium]
YAREWGAFVRVVDRGWDSVGMEAYAVEERGHALLWDEFADALGTQAVDAPETAQLAALRGTAERLFSTPATALGALYAFEAQQPSTSVSKLAGLRTHYSLDEKAEQYFAVHENDYAEAEWIRAAIGRLSPAGREVAEAACEAMCQALWDGLSGIYNENCAMA